jgi:hypothetical protein
MESPVHTTSPSTTERLRGAANEAGAATTEFAISALLLVPLLVGLGLVGELFSAMAKVQEAEIAASWEVSAYLLHDFGNTNRAVAPDYRYPPALSAVNQRLNQDMLYGLDSFDGNASMGEGRHLPFLTFSKQTVKCEKFDVPTARSGPESYFKPLLPFDQLATYDTATNAMYGNAVPASQMLHVYVPIGDGSSRTFFDTYVVCQSKLSATPLLTGFDASLHPWTHATSLLSGVTGPFELCGIGESLSGCVGPAHNASAGLVLLTDDWALDQGSSNDDTLTVNSDSAPQTSLNDPYFNVGQAIFGGGVGSSKIELAMQALLGVGDQADTNTFKFFLLDHQSDVRQVGSDVGDVPSPPGLPTPTNIPAHLTPYDTQAGAPSAAYNRRSNYLDQSHTAYLGSSDPTFKDGP